VAVIVVPGNIDDSFTFTFPLIYTQAVHNDVIS